MDGTKIQSYLARGFLILIIILSFMGEYFEEYLENMGEDSTNGIWDYAKITDVDYKATLVDEPGSLAKVVVKERITFDIHAASKSNLFWELWRDLPEDYIDGMKTSYTVKSVKQIMPDGTEEIYREAPKLYWYDSDYRNTAAGLGPKKWYYSPGPYDEENGDYEAVMIYIDGMYREQPVFEIEYEMTNAAIRYEDCSELYLCMYSEETIKHLKSFKGEILIDRDDMPKKENYTAHTYGTNSNEFKFKESDETNPGYHTFSFSLNRNDLKFKPYNQYIEFSLVSFGDDSHSFTDYAPIVNKSVLEKTKQEQTKYEQAPKKAFTNKILVFLACMVLSYWCIKKILSVDSKIRDKNIFYEASIKPHFFRDIPGKIDPIFAADFAFCKDKPSKVKKLKDGLAAIMLSLVKKGYVETEKIDTSKDWVSSNVRIVVKHFPTPPAPPTPEESIQAQSYFQNPETITNPNDLKIAEGIPVEENELEAQPKEPELEPLSLNEEYYFKLITRYTGIDNTITIKELEKKISTDYEYMDTFVTNIENSTVNIGISEKYFQKANYKEPRNNVQSQSAFMVMIGFILVTIVNFISSRTRLDMAFGGFSLLGIVNMIGGVYLFKNSYKYVLLTQTGEQEFYQWNGLYNFLNSETLIKERTVIELPLWEDYLIYATAFGISEKVIKALKVRCPEAANSAVLSNPYYRTNYFYSSHRTFHTSAHRASYTARSGGYGGYGGGGRGGGGGRRRSLKYKKKTTFSRLFFI